MRRIQIIGLLVVGIVAFGLSKSHAGFHFEPSLGYGTGKFELESSLGTNESDVDSVVLGLRAGLAYRGFFIGPDLQFGLGSDFEPSLSDPNIGPAGSPNGDSNVGNVHLTVGYKIPILPLRVYAGYGIYHSYSLDFSDGSDADFEGSGGYKLGIGYKPGLAFLRLPLFINLEYLVTNFDEASGIGVLGGNNTEFPFITGTNSSIAQYNDAEIQSILLSISVPFDLFGSN